MLFPALVIGSGPCGAAVFAKLRALGVDAWLIDHGREAHVGTRVLAERLSRMPSRDWPVIPIQRAKNGQNMKTWLGDDFATDDHDGVFTSSTALKASHAFGGLSWVWGCSVARWDDLREFPKGMTDAYDWLDRNVTVAESGVLSAAARRWHERARALAGDRFSVAYPRLTIDPDRCLRCGLCMGGCPIRATWVAADWVRQAAPVARTLLGWRVDAVFDRIDHVEVRATSADGATQRWLTRRLFIAAGAAGSAAIALASNPGLDQIRLSDPRYAMGVALLAPGIAPPPGEEDDHALAKLKLTDHEAGIYWQGYTRMPQTDAYLTKGLPRRVGLALSRRLGVLQGFLAPGPGSVITIRRNGAGFFAQGAFDEGDRPRLRAGLAALRRERAKLGAYPLPGMRLGHAGEGQHAGCGLPMGTMTDALGRLPGQSRVHYVDPIVLPKLPAAPHTWTAMANAVRIAEATLHV
jgi:ferredoxin